METKDIIKTLRQCTNGGCVGCPLDEEFEHNPRCISAIETAAADEIEKLLDRCARYAEEIAALQERARWIPVTERLPEKEAWYLVAILDKKLKKVKVEQDLFAIELANRHGYGAGFCKAHRWEGRDELIAWMPLPAGPEVE